MKSFWSLLWAARFVAKWEGWLPVAVWDNLASPPLLTQGYGHTHFAGEPIPREGTRWSRAKGLRVLANDCRAAAAAVASKIRHRLTVRQRIALISATFNLGAGVLETLAPMINRGEIKRAADKLLEFNHAGGVVVEGLTNRRKAERWMMLHSKARHRNPHKAHPHRRNHAAHRP